MSARALYTLSPQQLSGVAAGSVGSSSNSAATFSNTRWNTGKGSAVSGAGSEWGPSQHSSSHEQKQSKGQQQRKTSSRRKQSVSCEKPNSQCRVNVKPCLMAEESCALKSEHGSGEAQLRSILKVRARTTAVTRSFPGYVNAFIQYGGATGLQLNVRFGLKDCLPLNLLLGLKVQFQYCMVLAASVAGGTPSSIAPVTSAIYTVGPCSVTPDIIVPLPSNLQRIDMCVLGISATKNVPPTQVLATLAFNNTDLVPSISGTFTAVQLPISFVQQCVELEMFNAGCDCIENLSVSIDKCSKQGLLDTKVAFFTDERLKHCVKMPISLPPCQKKFVVAVFTWLYSSHITPSFHFVGGMPFTCGCNANIEVVAQPNPDSIQAADLANAMSTVPTF